ncbi:hypothetical protein Goshw_024464, partial [Gossypium schwendimanii]|nr:hypothetical protein [Gossypium schwendimanii]
WKKLPAKVCILNTDEIVKGRSKLASVGDRLRLAKNLGISKLIVELDASLVEGWILEGRHVLRKGNMCVHHLANLAQDIAVGVVLLGSPPASIYLFILADACGRGIVGT